MVTLAGISLLGSSILLLGTVTWLLCFLLPGGGGPRRLGTSHLHGVSGFATAFSLQESERGLQIFGGLWGGHGQDAASPQECRLARWARMGQQPWRKGPETAGLHSFGTSCLLPQRKLFPCNAGQLTDRVETDGSQWQFIEGTPFFTGLFVLSFQIAILKFEGPKVGEMGMLMSDLNFDVWELQIKTPWGPGLYVNNSNRITSVCALGGVGTLASCSQLLPEQ